MAMQTYRNTNFRPETVERIERINEILSEYALPPRELNRLVEEAIAEYIDMKKYNAVLKEEKRQGDRLKKALEGGI